MASMSISSSSSAPHMMHAAPSAHQLKPSTKPTSGEGQKTAASSQGGGNGKPSAPVSTSTKTVPSHHRVDVKV